MMLSVGCNSLLNHCRAAEFPPAGTKVNLFIFNISLTKAFSSKDLSEPCLCPQQMPYAALLPQLWVRWFCAGEMLCRGHSLAGVCPPLPCSSLGSSAAALLAGDEGLYQKSEQG